MRLEELVLQKMIETYGHVSTLVFLMDSLLLRNKEQDKDKHKEMTFESQKFHKSYDVLCKYKWELEQLFEDGDLDALPFGGKIKEEI